MKLPFKTFFRKLYYYFAFYNRRKHIDKLLKVLPEINFIQKIHGQHLNIISNPDYRKYKIFLSNFYPTFECDCGEKTWDLRIENIKNDYVTIEVVSEIFGWDERDTSVYYIRRGFIINCDIVVVNNITVLLGDIPMEKLFIDTLSIPNVFDKPKKFIIYIK